MGGVKRKQVIESAQLPSTKKSKKGKIDGGLVQNDQKKSHAKRVGEVDDDISISSDEFTGLHGFGNDEDITESSSEEELEPKASKKNDKVKKANSLSTEPPKGTSSCILLNSCKKVTFTYRYIVQRCTCETKSPIQGAQSCQTVGSTVRPHKEDMGTTSKKISCSARREKAACGRAI
jgi:hypothetical protein